MREAGGKAWSHGLMRHRVLGDFQAGGRHRAGLTGNSGETDKVGGKV